MSAPRLVHRDDAILLVIDLQERLAAVMQHRDRVIAATLKLVRLAALLHWPIAITRQNPDGLGDIVPELAALLGSAELEEADVHFVDKLSFCCCEEPSFDSVLASVGRKQLVIAGMETHVCVAQTALVLQAGDYGAYVAADACCSQDDADAKLALQRMRRDGVVVTTSQAAMYEAVGRAGSDEFRALLRIVKGE